MQIFLGYDGKEPIFQSVPYLNTYEKILTLEHAIQLKNQYKQQMARASRDYDHYLQNERHDTHRPSRGF